ncbi:MAG: 4Fe-4S cluster-binding domain-containing protein [Methanobrevibacter sp.]|nr:4Fe-4S cluster-binding domain-containing protein [Methanobrevibacter sp.]
MTVRITNIQRFSLHDGPGIRTTVFLKGCNLHCPWCCNVENISPDIEHYIENGVEKDFGYDIGLDDLEKEILKDEAYYDNGKGGVTFSGGEPLLQVQELESLLKSLKSKNVNICFETALSVNEELVSIALQYADFIYVDVKLLSNPSIVGLDLDLYYKNLELINNSSLSSENIVFRIPLNYEYTLTDENMNMVIDLLKSYPDFSVEIFKTHNLAESKYAYLNKEFVPFKEVSNEDIDNVLNRIKEFNDNVDIISF